jgi:hypothetical protein
MFFLLSGSFLIAGREDSIRSHTIHANGNVNISTSVKPNFGDVGLVARAFQKVHMAAWALETLAHFCIILKILT